MKQQTWEERFDEEFTVMDEDSGGNLQRVLFLDTGTFMESIDSEIKLKKFIQSELQRQREEMEKMVFEAIEKTKCNLLELKSFEFYPSESGYEIGPGIKKPVKMEIISIDKYEWARIFNSSLDHLKKYLSDDIIKKVAK